MLVKREIRPYQPTGTEDNRTVIQAKKTVAINIYKYGEYCIRTYHGAETTSQRDKTPNVKV
jgi:hypothetical protein